MADYSTELSEIMPETPGDPDQGFGINLKRLMKLRGRMIVLLFFALAVPPSILFWYMTPGEYVANGTLEFKNVSTNVLTDAGRIDTMQSYSNYVNTQVKLLTSPTILLKVVEDEEVMALPGLAESANPLWDIMGSLEAAPVPLTELVTVTYTGEHRETVIAVLNKVLEAYEEYAKRQGVERGGEMLATLKGSENELNEELDKLRSQITFLSDELGVAVSERYQQENIETEVYRERHASARDDAIQADTNLRNSILDVQRIEGLLEVHAKNPSLPIYQENVEQLVDADAGVSLAAEELTRTKALLDSEKQRFALDHPRVKRLEREVSGLQREFESLRSKTREKVLQVLLAEYKQNVQMAKHEVEQARDRSEEFLNIMKEEEAKKLDEARDYLDIDVLRQEQQDKRATLETVRNRIYELELQTKAPARAKVVNWATASEGLDHTDAIKMILLSILGAGTVSVGLGLVLEMLDQRIRSAREVAYVTDLPVLASIPHLKEDKLLPRDTRMETVAHDYPDSMTSDQFRQIVARILHWSQRGYEIKSCAIMSPTKREGKTTLACNVAIALAQADRRVLLVDLDSRNPTIENHFGLKPAAGLLEMLSGEQLAQDPDRATELDNLYVLGPGLRNKSLIERLASKEMVDFIQGAERIFDIVIIDTPPTLFTAESKLLAPLVNGIIVVAGAGICSFGMLRRCLRNIEETGGAILGIVVNGVRHAPGGYLRRNIKLYYKHNQGLQSLPAPSKTRALPPPEPEPEPSTFVVKDGATGDEEI